MIRVSSLIRHPDRTLFYDDPKSVAAPPKSAPSKPVSDIDTIPASLGLAPVAEKSPPAHKTGDSEFEARLLHVGTFSTVGICSIAFRSSDSC